MLIDTDSKPENTIFYLAAQMLMALKKESKIPINRMDNFFREIISQQPMFKFQLALDFLFLLDKITIEGEDIVYVP